MRRFHPSYLPILLTLGIMLSITGSGCDFVTAGPLDSADPITIKEIKAVTSTPLPPKRPLESEKPSKTEEPLSTELDFDWEIIPTRCFGKEMREAEIVIEVK